MATVQRPLNFGTINDAVLNTIYVNGISQVHPFLVVTNTLAASVVVEVSIDDGMANRIIGSRNIAGGNGKMWRVLEISDVRLSTGYTVSIMLPNGGTVNFFLSGIETDDT